MNNREVCEFGIYIHYPFCIQKCPYCAFTSFASSNKERAEFENELCELYLSELKSHSTDSYWKDKTLVSIFFGGGTPSLANNDTLIRTINFIKSHFNTSNKLEVTLEANPGTVEEFLSVSRLQSLKELGINRISLGAQSFKSEKLEFLGRWHKADDIYKTVENIRQSGITNFNLDLIYATIQDSTDSWKEEIKEACSLSPNHISAYTLSIENGTDFFRRHKKGTKLQACEADFSQSFYNTVQLLSESEINQYEVSNFARSGYECLHNKVYWNAESFIGIGPSATSYRAPDIGISQGTRSKNCPSLKDYSRKVHETGIGASTKETLNKKELEIEFIFLKLRTLKGLTFSDYKKAFSDEFVVKYREQLTALSKEDLIHLKDDRVLPTTRGLLFSDYLIEQLI